MATPDEAARYLADITYPDRFYRELSPAWLNYVAAISGVAGPRPTDQAFTYLDLGCGFARSTIMNAGAYPWAEFHACDFNPAHIEAADRYRRKLGIDNVHFHRSYFEDLLTRDLPPFDFIVLHGVYSWVGPEVRLTIRRLISEKLKDGGLVYVSYNCLPGWAAEAPLRKLMQELAAVETGGIERRARRAVEALRGLAGGNFRFFRDNPAVAAAVEAMVTDPADYLAHEFLNETWALYYSIDVADDMAEAGLRYVGSATLPYNHPFLIIDKHARAVVAKAPTPRLQQLAVDFAVDQRFRRDVFARGGAPADRQEAAAWLDGAVIGCVDEPEQIPVQVTIPRGKITFQEDFVGGLRAALRGGALRVAEVASQLRGSGRNPAEIRQNLLFLTAAGALMPFARPVTSQAAAPSGVANGTVKKAFDAIVEAGVPGLVPCEQAGNGVPIKVAEAAAAMKWLRGEDTTGRLPPRLMRLGLLI